MSNPFSSERPASPEIFRGYTEKQFEEQLSVAWNLEDITNCFLRSNGVAPSFWIIGERKLGKTSFLLKLENLLLQQTARVGIRRGAVPLYLCCTQNGSLLSFYRGIHERAQTLFKDFSQKELHIPQLGEDEALEDRDLLDFLADGLSHVAGQLSTVFGRTLRLVLLIDQVEAAVHRGWGPSLFLHLRALLTQSSYPPSNHDLLPENLSVVVAGSRTLQEDLAFSDLTDVLEEVPLRPLLAGEVEALLTRRAPLDSRLRDRIYRATAGHPWLVQFIMEQFVGFYQEDPEQLDRHFEDLITARFQKDLSRSLIFRDWLDCLPETGSKMLAHLALNRDTAKDLVQRTGLPAKTITDHLQQMADLGIAFKPTFPRGDRYALGEIFKDWFLEHTGGKVFLNEINNLQRQAASLKARVANSDKVFSLLLSLHPEVVIADGFFARQAKPQGLLRMVDTVEFMSRKAKEKRDLDVIVSNIQIMQQEWEEVWKDYVRRMETEKKTPIFAMRVTDSKLLEFPIEFLQLDDNYLGLTAPVYKEVVGIRREPAYRLSSGLFSTANPLNVLLVASSRGGNFENRLYSPLPRTEQEVAEIAEALVTKMADAKLAIGKIFALTQGGVPDQVERLDPSSTQLERALKGELGVQFHLLHYSGHYVHHEREESSGLLFLGDASSDLFTLAKLRRALYGNQLLFTLFNGCQSAQHMGNGGYDLGIAHTTLSCGVPVFIGMRWIIGDDEGLIFSRAFYKEFLRSGVPEVALWEARRIVHVDEGAGSILWAAPVMLTR